MPTKLNKGQEIAYNNWLNKNNIKESDDYDMRGYWKDKGFLQEKHSGHFLDMYKLKAPFSKGDGYMQISDESKYSGNPTYNTGINNSFDKRGQGTWILDSLGNDKFVAYAKGGKLKYNNEGNKQGRKEYAEGGWLDNIQLGLDAAQFIPVVGEAAYLASLPFTTYDVAKGIYDGNYKQAGLDALGYIPGLKAFKYGIKGGKVLDTTSKLAKQYNKINNVVNTTNLLNDATKNKKAHGGWLDGLEGSQILPKDSTQYNNAYNSPSNQGKVGFNTEKDYLNNWFSSQRFKDKIGTVNPDSVSNQAVNKIKNSKLFYNPNDTKGSIENYVDMHTNTTNQDKKELLKHKAVGKSYKDSNDAIITKVEGQNNPNSISIHELTHLTNLDELTKSKFKPALYQDKYGTTRPFNRVEAYPSLMQFRYDNNFKPDQVITPEDMKNIRSKGYKNILDDKYTDDEILNYLNTVADNSTPNKNIMAEGGTLELPVIPKSQQEAQALLDNKEVQKKKWLGSLPAPITKEQWDKRKPASGAIEESVSPLDFIPALDVAGMVVGGAAKLATRAGKLATPLINDAVKGIKDELYNFKYKKQIANLESKKYDAIQKINNPEGYKRLREQGIDPKKFLSQLKNTPITSERRAGSWDSGTEINIDFDQLKRLKEKGYNLTLESVLDHEIGHRMQRGFNSKAVQEYNKDMLNLPKSLQNQLTVPNYITYSTPLDKESAELLAPLTKNMKHPNADYFFQGSEYHERLPFLRETKREMLDKGYISNLYDKITPNITKAFLQENPGNRFATFLETTQPLTHRRLSTLLNKTPVITGGLVAGKQIMNDNKKSKGGWLDNLK